MMQVPIFIAITTVEGDRIAINIQDIASVASAGNSGHSGHSGHSLLYMKSGISYDVASSFDILCTRISDRIQNTLELSAITIRRANEKVI